MNREKKDLMAITLATYRQAERAMTRHPDEVARTAERMGEAAQVQHRFLRSFGPVRSMPIAVC
jgi:hypothetical protein